MEKYKWINGRQSDVLYRKLCFLHKRIGRFGFDGYLLRYTKGTKLPIHKDEVEGGQHWRLNIVLKGKSVFFHCNGTRVKLKICGPGSFTLFRPDIEEHSLHTVSRSLKLSFGFVKYK